MCVCVCVRVRMCFKYAFLGWTLLHIYAHKYMTFLIQPFAYFPFLALLSITTKVLHSWDCGTTMIATAEGLRAKHPDKSMPY